MRHLRAALPAGAECGVGRFASVAPACSDWRATFRGIRIGCDTRALPGCCRTGWTWQMVLAQLGHSTLETTSRHAHTALTTPPSAVQTAPAKRDANGSCESIPPAGHPLDAQNTSPSAGQRLSPSAEQRLPQVAARLRQGSSRFGGGALQNPHHQGPENSHRNRIPENCGRILSVHTAGEFCLSTGGKILSVHTAGKLRPPAGKRIKQLAFPFACFL